MITIQPYGFIATHHTRKSKGTFLVVIEHSVHNYFLKFTTIKITFSTFRKKCTTEIYITS